jgi:hypothetical protein
MEKLKAKGEPWDMVSIFQECESGREFLADVVPEQIPLLPSMAPVYARKVREHAWNRMTQEIMTELSRMGPSIPTGSGQAQRAHGKEEPEGSAKSMRDAAKTVFDDWKGEGGRRSKRRDNQFRIDKFSWVSTRPAMSWPGARYGQVSLDAQFC